MDELRKITEAIKKKYKPEKIILFGSYAWGKPEPGSDIDLFVIKKTKKKFIDRIGDVDRIVADSEMPTDVIVYTPIELKKRQEIGDFFVKRILNEGKLLYEKR